MLRLRRFSGLVEPWKHWQRIISASPMDSEGFLTCSIVGAYLQDVEINMTHEDFWDGLTYVLGKMNEDVMKRRKMKEKRK